jgi:hypothetical protein
VSIVSLEDLSRVLMLQGGSCGAGDVKEKIYAYREIGCINKSRAAVFNQLPYAIDFPVPRSCADNHVLARRNTGLDMADDAGRSGKVDHHIDCVQLIRSESLARHILCGAHDLDAVSALARHLRYERTRLAATE